MTLCLESDIEFDFTAAKRVVAHDPNCKCEGTFEEDGNSLFPCIDFRIEDNEGWVWMEVKNWRGRMRGSFRHKVRSETFAEEMRCKFLGTAAFLAFHSLFSPVPIRYILLFEPPNRDDIGMLAPFQDIVRRKMPNARRLEISVFVMDIDRWNELFVQFPARKTY